MSESNLSEQWLPVVGYESLYEVSNCGRVRNSGLLVMSQTRNRVGRMTVKLCRKSVYHTYSVHRLVLHAFVGPAPGGCVCCHNNGNASDNRIANLRWDTPIENERDKDRHGTRPFGENDVHSTLRERDVVEIIALEGQLPVVDLAKRFGVSPQAICTIHANRSWKHVPRPCKKAKTRPRYCSKITELDAMEILRLRGAFTVDELGARFGISRWTIYGIWRGRTWAHLAQQDTSPNESASTNPEESCGTSLSCSPPSDAVFPRPKE